MNNNSRNSADSRNLYFRLYYVNDRNVCFKLSLGKNKFSKNTYERYHFSNIEYQNKLIRNLFICLTIYTFDKQN